MIAVMRLPREQRNDEQSLKPVIDFLKTLKFFSPHIGNKDIMLGMASNIEMVSFNKGDFVFEQGDVGTHFFMILGGEVSIVNVEKDEFDGSMISMNVLVKMFRGQSFGDTALESRGA